MSVFASIGTDTRVKLLTTAERLFAWQGYAEISTRQIAAAAGLNAVLINYYFDRKRRFTRKYFYQSKIH